MKQAEYKPLLYTTTIRNPERFKDFMNVLKKFDGEILNDTTIELFERKLFKIGLYRPRRISESVAIKWSTTKSGEFSETPLTDEETKYIYDANDPLKHPDIAGHQDAGFKRGWQTRFNTQFLLMKTLGFVYYKIGEPIKFSETGNYLANSVSIKVEDDTITREIVNPQYEQMAFLQAFSKQQRRNPFIRELNDNIPLILLLQVIKKLNADPKYNNCGISYKEIPLIIFWKDNNAENLYLRIKQLRTEHGYNPSNEVIEDICINEILGGFKKFKLKSIVSEYPDEFVRKMRMTGLISFRGGGRFIDINHAEDEKTDYILKHYSKYKKYSSEQEYFDYMASVDTKLFALKAMHISKNASSEKLGEWTSVYTWTKIKSELNNLSKKSSSKDEVLKFIAAPARLEFLTALAIKIKYPDITVIPNYPCDDTGLPTSTAGGNVGDIECHEKGKGILIEVTMAEGRQQTIMEVWPIERHLETFKNICDENAQCVFIAPSIFSDTFRQIKFVRADSGNVIRPYKISDFIAYLDSAETLYSGA